VIAPAALLLAAALAGPPADEACAVAAAVAAGSGEQAHGVVRGKSTSGDLFAVPLRLVPGLADEVRRLLQTPDAAAPGEAVDCTAAFAAAGVGVGDAAQGWSAYFARPVFSPDGRLAAVYRWAASSEDAIRMDVVVARKAGGVWRVADSYLINMGEP
jgi:hypothetical protein